MSPFTVSRAAALFVAATVAALLPRPASGQT
jgi:hypothetical protein